MLCRRCHKFAPQVIDGCTDCFAWGLTRHTGFLCEPCRSWRRKHQTLADCARCARHITVDHETVCRLCRKQRLHDQAHGLPEAQGRWHQLFFNGMFHAHRRLRRPAPSRPLPARPRHTSRQLALFKVAKPADPRGWARPCPACSLKPVIKPSKNHCHDCAPGGPLIPPACTRCGSTRDYYSSGLCRRCHRGAPTAVDSCLDCFAWGATRTTSWLCSGCRSWRENHLQVEPCVICGRRLNVRDGACRLCWRQACRLRGRNGSLDLISSNRHGQQLFLADMFQSRKGSPRTVPAPPPVVQPVLAPSRWPVTHRQMVLFDAVRDIGRGQLHGFPEPPDAVLAAFLDEQAIAFAQRHGWGKGVIQRTRYVLRVLLGLQDTPGAPIKATDVLSVSQLRIYKATAPTTAFLADIGMLDDDRPLSVEPWFDRQTADLPEQMTAELRIWFDVLLHGRTSPPRSKPRTPRSIQQKLTWAMPVLREWARTRDSLREITRDDVLASLPESGTPRATTLQGLRSIFKTLKRHKVTFINPTARIILNPTPQHPPLPADLEPVRHALSSGDPARAALTALVAYHALPPRHLRALRVTDLRDGRLWLDDRVIVLAQPASERLSAYLDHRTQRWPKTANPHLFLNHCNAGYLTAVHADWITDTIGISAQAIVEDRILHEAQATHGDIRRLCDLFGLSVSAAERYLAALNHPAIDEQ